MSRPSRLRDDRFGHRLERMKRLRIDLVDERRVVPVAGPAVFLGEQELEIDDPPDRREVDDLDSALRANVFEVFDQLPDRSHRAGIVSPRGPGRGRPAGSRAERPAPARMSTPPKKMRQPKGSPSTRIPRSTAISVSIS